ncbi:hypothetical protein ACQ4PT_051509 [Festuca glaucescens]
MTKPDRTRDDAPETERAAKKRSVHPDIGASSHAEVVVSSYTLSSPLRKPYIPDELADPTAHPEILATFEQAKAQYEAKLDALNDLCHFDYTGDWEPLSMFPGQQLLPIHDLAKTAVLRAAKSIVRLSSSLDGKPLTDCCGLWIDWSEKSKIGVVLTTAHIICTKHPTANQWKGRDEYNAEANATVHLRDGTTAEGRLLYHQEHYDLAFFQVKADLQVHLPSFNETVHCGQEVIRLGRDEKAGAMLLYLKKRITNGRVECLNPSKYERHHYMYFHHEDPNYKVRNVIRF